MRFPVLPLLLALLLAAGPWSGARTPNSCNSGHARGWATASSSACPTEPSSHSAAA